jgi:hypothetical protein
MSIFFSSFENVFFPDSDYFPIFNPDQLFNSGRENEVECGRAPIESHRIELDQLKFDSTRIGGVFDSIRFDSSFVHVT